jgi:hypothetical protein
MTASQNLSSATAKISRFRLAGLLIPILALLLMVGYSTPARAGSCEGACVDQIGVIYVAPGNGVTEWLEFSDPWWWKSSLPVNTSWTVYGDVIGVGWETFSYYTDVYNYPTDLSWEQVIPWGIYTGYGWSFQYGIDPFVLDTWIVISVDPPNVGNISWNYYNNEIPGEEYICPTPEPGTMILLGSGLLSLAGVVRRKFRRS